jgi:hypothetical protein
VFLAILSVRSLPPVPHRPAFQAYLPIPAIPSDLLVLHHLDLSVLPRLPRRLNPLPQSVRSVLHHLDLSVLFHQPCRLNPLLQLVPLNLDHLDRQQGR